MADELLVKQQFRELRERHKNISLIYWYGSWSIEGKIWFLATYQDKPIEDEYFVKIFIPKDYPNQYPKTEEVFGRIPKNFHHYEDDSLCLGAPYQIARIFKKLPTLLGFTDNCLIPYLYSFSYKSLYGFLPYGELPHGWLGLLEYYQNEFRVLNKKSALGLLKVLSEDYQTINIICPCNSKKNISKCHGRQLREMLFIKSAYEFKMEYDRILFDISSRINLLNLR